MRSIKAARGPQLRCKGWRQEALLRLLENNLENGEKPEDLIVYTSAKAARNWESFDEICALLRDLDADETLIVQSGKAVARMKSRVDGPLVIMANGNVLGRWSDAKYVYELEQKGLTIYPGMTAAAWQYIGSQGILQGTYQCLRAAADIHFGGSLKGRVVLSSGMGGMGGAQPLAGKMAGAATLVVEIAPERVRRRIESGYLEVATDNFDEAVALVKEAAAAGQGKSIGLVGNAVNVYEALLDSGLRIDVMTDQCNTDPYRGYVPVDFSLADATALAKTNVEELVAAANPSFRRHARAMLEFRRRGAVVFEYGNGLRLRAHDAGEEGALELPSFVTEFIRPYFCQGIGPFRWIAVTGNPQDIERIDDLVLELFPAGHRAAEWVRAARGVVPFQGLPARIGWLGYGERSLLAVRVNQLVREGVIGPIAFTRDHLDTGSVANPVRETEKLPDGSDAVSDWPLLNAMLACTMGADLVAIHAGDGRWQSAGQTCVADGSDHAEERLKRVLDGDTAIGIVRHAEAGLPLAVEARKAAGLGLGGGVER
ncbi:MAG: urocanate hydratase [Pseudomonadota bacterium]